jgi:hypothetical protein
VFVDVDVDVDDIVVVVFVTKGMINIVKRFFEVKIQQNDEVVMLVC